MYSPSDRFECHWQASRLLLTVYLATLSLALFAVTQLDVSRFAIGFCMLVSVVHGLWVVPRSILLTHRTAFRGLRRDADGWQIWSRRDAWQAIEVCGDTVVLPLIVILRFRLQRGDRPELRSRSICIPRDALAPDIHRRLRVRLKFSRRGLAGSE